MKAIFSVYLQLTEVKFTFEPSTDPNKPVSVLASPPNTFILTSAFGIVQRFKLKVTSFSGQAGIKIRLPPDQLEYVYATDGDDVVIKAGFTSLVRVIARANSTLEADLTTMHANRTITEVSAYYGASTKIKTNVPIGK